MADTRVLSNGRVGLFAAPDTAISDWEEGPTLAEATAFQNYSEATKWDGFDFNIEASEQSDDRSLTDGAGAQSRSFSQFGGAVALFTPKPDDTTSILRQARNTFATPRTRLNVMTRTVKANTAAIAPGDEVNVYRVITDAKSEQRGDVSYSYTSNLRPQDKIGVNRIIPSSTPTAVTLTVANGGLSAAIGVPLRLRAAYEGRNVTIGARYVSSNPLVASVDKHGIVLRHTAGTASITATYPGSAAGAATTVTVTA